MADAYLLTRTLMAFAILLVVVPALALPRPQSAAGPLDRIVVNALRFCGIAIVAGHVLVVVRLFTLLPLLLLVGLGVWWTRLRGRGLLERGPTGSVLQEVWLLVVDVLVLLEKIGPRALLARWRAWAHQLRTSRHRMARLDPRLVALVSPVLLVLGASLALRLRVPLDSVGLTPSGAYVQLTWARAINRSELWPDGIYPQGLPILLAMLGRAAPGVELADVVRFAGPVLGALTAAGLFWCVLRMTRNVGAATVAAASYGLFGSNAEWHSPWPSQVGVVPLTAALVLALFALPYAVAAVTERRRDHLVTTALASTAIGFVHPVALGFFLVLAAAAVLVTTVLRPAVTPWTLRVLAAGGVGGLVSLAPVPVGLFLGSSLHYGLDDLWAAVSTDLRIDEQIALVVGDEDISAGLLTVVAGLAATAALLVSLTVARWRRLPGWDTTAALAVAGMGAALLYDPRWLRLPTQYAGSVATLAGPALALGLGAAVAAVGVLWAQRTLAVRSAASLGLAAVTVAAVGVVVPPSTPQVERSEYASMAAVTRKILDSNDAFSYTLVGAPEQRQLAAGRTNFIELWVFARDVTLRDAQDPGFVVPDVTSLLFTSDVGISLPIPTADVYVFVEKNPFPVKAVPVSGPNEEYYYDREKRGRIMALVYSWAEYYRYYHTDMSVYFEDDDIVVYRIRRHPDPAQAAAAPQFKDYTWEKGRLFTAGPTSPQEIDIPWARER